MTAGAHDRVAAGAPHLCPHYHRAVELVGRRWSGAILAVLLEHGPLRFSEISAAVPEMSDRLLTERVKELEAHGLLARADAGYALTEKGESLGPVLDALGAWARRWLAP